MARRRVILGVVGWVLVAAGAVAIGMLAVSLLGRGLTDGTSQPLSSDAVTRALQQAQASATPTASRRPPNEPTPDLQPTEERTPKATPDVPRSASRAAAANRRFDSPGGTVLARCRGDQAYLTSWSPHPGFEVDEVERGWDSTTSVQFESDDVKVKLVVRCRGGQPVVSQETDAD